MTTQSRSQLVDDLERYQQSGDFAAQAETLFALAQLAQEEEEHDLAHGLYGQAWEASQRAGDQIGVARALRGIGDLISKTLRTQFIDRNIINLWDEPILGLAIELREYQIQAATYLSMSRHHLRWQLHGTLRGFTFACYDIRGSVPLDIETIPTPKYLSVHGSDYKRHGQIFREQLLAPYKRIGDLEAVAHILMVFGESGFWSKHYDEAREDLEHARQLFQTLNMADRLKRVLLSLMRMAYRIQDYDLYRDCHAQLLVITPRHDHQEILSLLLELALIAADYWDWPTARAAYQSAAAAAVASGEPYRQCRIYWQWGQMEYKARHFAMGEALCQWSIALVQRYDPDQVGNYQRELKQMRIRETQ